MKDFKKDIKDPSVNPLVSVMMPVYNGEKTLLFAINSLLNQTYADWICIIVNDGSTDATIKILNNLKDERFKVIHLPENKGRPFARQVALDNAEGEFLAFLDADDFYHPLKLQKQIETFEKYPEIDLVSCGMGSFEKKKDLLKVRGTNSNKVNKIIRYKFSGNFDAPHAASMTRMNISKGIGYSKKLKFAQDSDFFVRYLSDKKYFIYNKVLYYYSEYESVSKMKIIKTKYYDLIKLLYYVKEHPVVSVKAVFVTLFKLTIIIMISPFVNKHYFTKKRGVDASLIQKRDFENVILNYKSNL